MSIGISYFLEKKSKKQPDDTYTYGYARFSVIGGVITTVILLVGSVAVIYNAIVRIFNPVEINYNGMIIFAIFGVIVNFSAAYFTSGGHSINQKAVNLHMLEDVLGWAIVLLGALIMRFTKPNKTRVIVICLWVNSWRVLPNCFRFRETKWRPIWMH
jgi:cobalt-zinc-cadmium efflux system protein